MLIELCGEAREENESIVWANGNEQYEHDEIEQGKFGG